MICWLNLFAKTVRFCVVFIAVLFIGQTILGLRITALVAGAGIAGLAVALAAKDTLANFFGSVMIMLDKPFTVGERITVRTRLPVLWKESGSGAPGYAALMATCSQYRTANWRIQWWKMSPNVLISNTLST